MKRFRGLASKFWIKLSRSPCCKLRLISSLMPCMVKGSIGWPWRRTDSSKRRKKLPLGTGNVTIRLKVRFCNSIVKWKTNFVLGCMNLDQCFQTQPRSTLLHIFWIPTTKYDQADEKQMDEKSSNVSACNLLLLMRNLSSHSDHHHHRIRDPLVEKHWPRVGYVVSPNHNPWVTKTQRRSLNRSNPVFHHYLVRLSWSEVPSFVDVGIRHHWLLQRTLLNSLSIFLHCGACSVTL